MGTYTANYQLYMPSIGEQGWGDLMNGNLTTIDTTMKGLSNNIASLSNNISSLDSRLDTVETYGSRITAIENEVNGALSCTSVTTSGNVIVKGNLTVNGTLTQSKITITVTPSSSTIPYGQGNTIQNMIPILPFQVNAVYSGTIKFTTTCSSGNVTIYYQNSNGSITSQSETAQNTYTKTIPSNTVSAYIRTQCNGTINVPIFSI